MHLLIFVLLGEFSRMSANFSKRAPASAQWHAFLSQVSVRSATNANAHYVNMLHISSFCHYTWLSPAFIRLWRCMIFDFWKWLRYYYWWFPLIDMMCWLEDAFSKALLMPSDTFSNIAHSFIDWAFLTPLLRHFTLYYRRQAISTQGFISAFISFAAIRLNAFAFWYLILYF